jgi:hypothetical protein
MTFKVPLTDDLSTGATAGQVAKADGAGGVVWGAGSVEYAGDNVSNPPTQEELTAAFGTPWTVGAGFVGLLDDGGAGSKYYAAFSDGTQWAYTTLALARSTLATDTLTRQGTVMEADVAWEGDNVFEPFVIYEASPQILTSLPHVYKMWYGGNWGSDNAIGYAESPDGVTWTKYSGNPVITDHMRLTVVEDGSTYVLFAANLTDTAIDRYTSPDGITWTQTHTSVIATGSGWEDAGIANTFVWIEGGTWYMLYEARGTKFSIGLATSSDGITWTKSGSNPVITETGTRGGPFVYKEDSTYWLFCQGSTSSTLPTDIYRYHATSPTSWTADGVYLARDGTDEGEGTSVGQVADPHIVVVNGVMRFWYEGTPDGTSGTAGQHIKLLTGKESLIWE